LEKQIQLNPNLAYKNIYHPLSKKTYQFGFPAQVKIRRLDLTGHLNFAGTTK
jgi:hypothetical protein